MSSGAEQNQPPQLLLSGMELETCRLRFTGFSSKAIEANLVEFYGNGAPKEKTIRNWFARGGRLCEFYKTYAEEESRERKKAVQHMFSAHVVTAMRTIIQIMLDPNKSPIVRFRAAQYIINREFGLPIKMTPNTKAKNLMRDIFEEAGLMGKKSQN